MADNEWRFVGQNQACILRVLGGTWHGTDGRRPSLSLGLIYIELQIRFKDGDQVILPVFVRIHWGGGSQVANGSYCPERE